MRQLTQAAAQIALVLALALMSSRALAGPDEDALARFEQDFATMQMTKDPAAIARIAADMDAGFRFTDPSAPDAGASKEEVLGLITSDKLVVETMDFRPFTIRIFGSTAIVEGVNASRGTFAGRDMSGTFAWVDVFEKRGGRWIWLFSQSGKVGDRLSDKEPCNRGQCPALQAGFSVSR